MHHFECHEKSSSNLRSAKEKYGDLFREGVSDEGIEARYHLLEYLRDIYHFTASLEKDENGKPLPFLIGENLYYWSITHTEHFVGYVLSDSPTGIDIIEHHTRDTSLLDIHHDGDYRLLGGKNWESFYTLWSAKESLIKALGITLDDMSAIRLSEVKSSKILIFDFQGNTYTIESIIRDSYTVSIFY